MDAVQIKFYDLLRKDLNLSNDKAAAFVTALGEVVELELKNERQSIATREDINNLDSKVEKQINGTREDIGLLELKIEKQSIASREDIHLLELKIEQSKGDLYKAMFWTGTVQLIAILAGVLAIVKFVT